ncbi:MAG: hypothetical protein EA407_01815 [Rhodobacteraceae bacterium]|nr:MAG: hypothetical protein EA407_01815 [Paracoccaceae bacterium]
MALPPEPPPHPDVRFVKRLVVVLTSVMIVGLILILGLLVIRIGLAPAPLGLPDHIALPEGTQLEAVTLSHNWVIVLGRDGEVLFFDRSSGALRHQFDLPAE